MIACNTLYRKPYPSVNLKFFSDLAAFCPPAQAPYKWNSACQKKRNLL